MFQATSGNEFDLLESEQQRLEEQSQVAFSLALQRKNPVSMAIMFQKVKSTAKAGDIIDICGYRGTGYYFVISNDDGHLVTRKTFGQYGCFLPSEAWQFIEQHGYEFFEHVDVWSCQLPPDVRLANIETNAEVNDEYLISWLRQDNLIEINGNTHRGEITVNK